VLYNRLRINVFFFLVMLSNGFIFPVTACYTHTRTVRYSVTALYIQGGSNMTGTCAACLHTNQSRSYLNHLVHYNSRGDVAVDNRAHVDTAFLTQNDS
jgi:hypothetical protein